jgi:co-chaperonin GroES (HSP10)
MTRLVLTPQKLLGAYPALQPAANAADVTFTSAGSGYANGASFPVTGGEILLVKNGENTSQTITIISVVDELKRSGNITNYNIGAGEIAAFGPFQPEGWMQDDGQVYIAASADDVSFAVLRF